MKLISQVLNLDLKEGFLRIAFASSDNKTINDHFGWATSFLIYDVSRTDFYEAGRIRFSLDEEITERAIPENKHFEKINALKTCHIVYSQSIGGPAAARLIQQKIHPMVVKHCPTISNTLKDLKALLNGPIPPWVRKIVKLNDSKRFESF